MDLSKPNVFHAGAYRDSSSLDPLPDAPSAEEVDKAAEVIEPWLSTLLQSEHLALMLGSGLTSAVAASLGKTSATMSNTAFTATHAPEVDARAAATAKACGRGTPNIEDQLRTAQSLIEGLRIIHKETEEPLKSWLKEYQAALKSLMQGVLSAETGILEEMDKAGEFDKSGLFGFLLAFASRPRPRERLEIFTTNYDRLIEYACDALGIRVLDRFVGSLRPSFRSSRVQVDLHYDPPGIRGEPRYLEGVVRLSKLHGSLDWRFQDNAVVREALPFGAKIEHPGVPTDLHKSVMIYPNAAKDVETLWYPYADLFRDFAASLCRPNTTLFCYGYGFGDDHVNRVIQDMLTLPSTHLVVISRSDSGGRISGFLKKTRNQNQLTVLVGKHFASLRNLATRYVPHASLPVTPPAPLVATSPGQAEAATAVTGAPQPASAMNTPAAVAEKSTLKRRSVE